MVAGPQMTLGNLILRRPAIATIMPGKSQIRNCIAIVWPA
jgi:hypothetical protein